MSFVFPDSLRRLLAIFGGAGRLQEALAKQVTVKAGRRDGEDETRVSLRWSLPAPPLPPPADDRLDPRERFLLATTDKRLGGWDGDREARKQWNEAQDGGSKGRCLIARDQQGDGGLAAIMAWHYEAKPKRGRRRPHLITALALPEVERALRAEFLLAAWLLTQVALVIDAKTAGLGRVGVVRDNAIALSLEDLELLGFQRGSKRDAYNGTTGC
jgi:hypothetical protein